MGGPGSTCARGRVQPEPPRVGPCCSRPARRAKLGAKAAGGGHKVQEGEADTGPGWVATAFRTWKTQNSHVRSHLLCPQPHMSGSHERGHVGLMWG